MDLFYKINPNISISKSTFYPSSNIKILPKIISDYLLMNNFAFSSTIYKITKNHITIQESTSSFSNSILCLNKINTSTALEDIEEAFIHRDIPIKILKKRESRRLVNDISDFLLVSSSYRTQLLKGGLVIKNQKKAVRDYINQYKLVYKCFTCNKIGHLTRNCKLKSKL